MRKPFIAGNWKMNGVKTSIEQVEALKAALAGDAPKCDVMLCPPATLVSAMADATQFCSIAVGGQDCHAAASGAPHDSHYRRPPGL